MHLKLPQMQHLNPMFTGGKETYYRQVLPRKSAADKLNPCGCLFNLVLYQAYVAVSVSQYDSKVLR